MTTGSPWIVGRRTDLALIFGGALATVLLPPVVLLEPEWLPVLFWIWLFAFDGTHIWGTYSRTYVDLAVA